MHGEILICFVIKKQNVISFDPRNLQMTGHVCYLNLGLELNYVLFSMEHLSACTVSRYGLRVTKNLSHSKAMKFNQCLFCNSGN